MRQYIELKEKVQPGRKMIFLYREKQIMVEHHKQGIPVEGQLVTNQESLNNVLEVLAWN